jgi:hypothetical protein
MSISENSSFGDVVIAKYLKSVHCFYGLTLSSNE